MEIIAFALIILTLPAIFECRYCIKEVTFDYGYGFYIKCDGLTDNDEKNFRNLYATKDTILELNQSDLTNFTMETFKGFYNIRGLIIDNTTINFEFFHNLNGLQYLNITNIRIDLNKIRLPLLPTMKRLILNDIDLKWFDTNLVRNFSNLETLDLSTNQLTNFTNLLNLPQLVIFRACNNNLIKIDLDNFISSNHSVSKRMKRLFFDYNKIRSIDARIFKIFENLEEISLNYNRLEAVSFVDLRNLQIIRLANNRLKRIELRDLKKLKGVFLDNNSINSLDNWGDLPNLESLSLNHNNLTNIALSKFNALKILHLSNNSLILNSNLLANLSNLIELYLSDNQFKQIPDGLFQNQKNLTILDLSSNYLTSLNNQTLSNLHNLIMLNLSYNTLTNLNYNSIKRLNKIERLDLTGNRLANFQYELILTNLPSLKSVDIKSNLLSCNSLEDMLQYLKLKNVSFTINKNFEYNKENVAGISCVELKSKGIHPILIIIIIILLILLILLCYFVMKASFYYFKRRKYISDELELL